MAYNIKRNKLMSDNIAYKSGHIKVTDDVVVGYYTVMYFDKNGMSVLAKTKDRLKAFQFAKKFQKQLYAGKLLKEDKSVWGK